MHQILYFCLRLVSHTPFWLLYAIADILYFPLYYVVRYRRKVTRKNLTESFPEKSLKEIKQIERRFYHFFLDMIVETCKLLTIPFDNIKRRAVFKNVDAVNALLDKGQSVSVYIGHYANWEWMTTASLWLTDKAQMVQIYHQLSNAKMERIVLQLRERFGNKCVLRNETVRYMISAEREQKTLCVGFIADQSPKRRESKHFLRFLNHEAPVLTGTEKLTKHFGHAAFYLTARRIRRGYYEYEFEPLCADPQSLPDYDLTHLYFHRLEQEILRQPELYLWTHNRFKYALEQTS